MMSWECNELKIWPKALSQYFSSEIIIMIIIIQRISQGSELPEKRKKTPDPPGLEPGTLLVMSNALTTELWDLTSPNDPLNLKFSQSFPNNNNNNKHSSHLP